MYNFQGVAPSVSQLRQTAGSIAFLLKLNDIPDFPMKELANKFIIQMDLPGTCNYQIDSNILTSLN